MYTTTKFCKRCGTSDRYPSGNCKQCSLESNRRLKEKDPERVNAYGRKHYALNLESRKEKNKEQYAKHSDARRSYAATYRKNSNKTEMAAYHEKYRAANREKINIYAKSYRAKVENKESIRVHKINRKVKIKTSGKLSPWIVKKLFILQRGLCPCCKQHLGADYHIDHIFPLALGGTNVDSNVQLLRSTCNLNKNAKHPVDFMQSRGFLL